MTLGVCALSECDESRALAGSPYCARHRLNEWVNGSPWHSARPGTPGYACVICGGRVLPPSAERIRSQACRVRARTLAA